jgi:hypothetical protein
MQRVEEPLTLLLRQGLQEALVYTPCNRFSLLQHATAGWGKTHRVGSGVLLCAAPLQQTLPLQAGYKVGKRGAIDACTLNQHHLAVSFVLRNSNKNRELARSQFRLLNLCMEGICRALSGSVQEVER